MKFYKDQALYTFTYRYWFSCLYSSYQLFWRFKDILYTKTADPYSGGTRYLYHLVDLVKYALFIDYIAVLIYQKMHARVILLLSLTLILGLLSDAKASFLYPFLSLFIISHYFKARMKLKYLLIIALLAILIFPFFNVYRHASELSEVLPATIDVFARPNLLVYHILDRFHGMDSFILIIRDTPDTMDFQMGKTILPLFVAWIPRVPWPDKPIISFAKIFGETYYGPRFAGTGTAPSPTIIGETYINFHVGGILWIALASGILLCALYENLIRISFGLSGVFVYISVFPSLFAFRESDIAGLLSRVAFSFHSRHDFAIFSEKEGVIYENPDSLRCFLAG